MLCVNGVFTRLNEDVRAEVGRHSHLYITMHLCRAMEMAFFSCFCA